MMVCDESANLYCRRILRNQYRVLGMLDRDEHSRTYGSMDRVHWAWKFTDFQGARFQEGLCFLTFLYSTELEGNILYRNNVVREWIVGGIRNWIGIQRRSGDFDEAYPGERSLAATAFTGFYLSEAFLLARAELGDDLGEKFEAALDRTATWLCKNDESHGFLSNHLAAAAATLLHAHQILGVDKYHTRYRHFLDKVISHQSEEGWYEEYGGADPGYQTHGMFYLARCQQLTGDTELLASLCRAADFLKHFVHPDGSLGGEYASRNTQTYYPAAFEMLASESGSARWIADELRSSVSSGRAAGLISVDSYNYFPLLNNYVFALRAIRERDAALAESDPPSESPYVLQFPQAGLVKVRTNKLDVIVGTSKGGVVKAFDRDRKRLIYSSSGYIGVDAAGKQCSNQVFDPALQATVSDSEIRLTAPFFGFSRPVMTPIKFLLFRVFSLTTGRFSVVATWLKSLLVKVLIYRKSELQIELSRRISIDDNSIDVIDEISGPDLKRLSSLQHRSVFTTIHMGSSRYFVPNELEVPSEIDRVDFSPGDMPAKLEFKSSAMVADQAG